ncbi:Hypothetical protein, putative [Bodo saltans]|uniref:SAM domain-containing protein n=1 Tax=Bodo saltans TaxID=75058 RepID=A0A0S4KIQ4_BODSA|nr:Hypothetical protein, putative [Bodo saltans]|eukprot:CUI14400.1 Hypothetical protein, putative [Bodo saltans]
MSDVSILQHHFDLAGVGHWTNILLRNDFTPRNIHLLNEKDLLKLRITNQKEQKQLLTAAKLIQLSSKDQAREVDTDVLRPTASDCCRSAASFLSFHHVDRAWPKRSSSLSSNIGLSNASTQVAPSFRVHMPQTAAVVVSPKPPPKRLSWKIINQRHCLPPPLPPTVAPSTAKETVTMRGRIDHSHGLQSARCECCDHHVRENAAAFSGGQWQYQSQEVVFVGESAVDHVFMWKPFAAVESLMIENAWRRKLSTVKIGGAIVDLGLMMWKTMQVRRNGDFSIGFPSLGKREVAIVSDLPLDHILSLESEFARSFLELTAAAEDQHRTAIELEEQSDLLFLRSEIAADVSFTFDQERAEVEELETQRRIELEAELAVAQVKLWDWFSNGIQLAMLATMIRSKVEEAVAVCARQAAILEDLESIARGSIEDQEQADMINLSKLVARFNAQVRAMLAGSSTVMTVDQSIRCPICNQSDCQFFTTKWKARWSHRGVVGSQNTSKEERKHENRGHSISALMAEVEEREYRDFIKQYPGKGGSRVQSPSPRLYRPPTASVAHKAPHPHPPPMRFGSSPRVVKGA